MGLEERYRYPWKPPYAPGWLLGWPCLWLVDGGDEEEEEEEGDGRTFVDVEEDRVWREGWGTAVGGGTDDNDNAISLYLQ